MVTAAHPDLGHRRTAGVAQEMWALFAVYQALCKITGIGDPAVTNVARYIQFHLLEPWMIT